MSKIWNSSKYSSDKDMLKVILGFGCNIQRTKEDFSFLGQYARSCNLREKLNTFELKGLWDASLS